VLAGSCLFEDASCNGVFRLTDTREAAIVHELLAGYKGVLVSDFYPCYDAMECRQQKCWVHLIRDLNDDLWKFPFDDELQEFILRIKNLFLPMIEGIDKHGRKRGTSGNLVSASMSSMRL
jgi:hypothetical protein